MSKIIRILAALLVTLMLLSVSFSAFAATSDIQTQNSVYNTYSAKKNPDSSLKEFSVSVENSGVVLEEFNGKKGAALKEEQTISLNFTVEKSGWYKINIEYYPTYVRGDKLEYKLQLDNELPFAECDTLNLPVNYIPKETEEDGGFLTDREGNQRAFEWMLENEWLTSYVQAYDGMQDEPYAFYITAGVHIVKLYLTDGRAAFSVIKFSPITHIPSYEEYIDDENKKGKNEDFELYLEAEKPQKVTNKVVTAFCDFSSPSVSPSAEQKQVMNALGGSMWAQSGSAVSYEINVKNNGWYTLAFHYRQDYTNGRAVVRKLLIDDEVPFSEANEIYFPYSSSWTPLSFADKNEKPYKIWLASGVHKITLDVSLGNMQSIIADTQDILSRLNAVYRRILTITGASPDMYRDYSLDEKIPETIESMKTISGEIKQMLDKLDSNTGAETGVLSRLVVQLDRFYKKPAQIAIQLSQFQSNISALGTWIHENYSQPLALDSIKISSSDNKIEFAEPSFINKIAHSVRQFFYSFLKSYNLSDTDKKRIEVWVPSGRDQAQIISQLAEDTFMVETGIDANIRLVLESALLPAVVAGRGPDVALMTPAGTPVNFATRGAAYNLHNFDDVDEVLSRFSSGATTPFVFGDGVYALPETLTFPMLFYRTDILNELGLSIPETWDDVRELITDLNHNNMQFGLSSSFITYSTFLYQNDGRIYTDNGEATGLDEQEAIEAFEVYTQLYKEYKLPVSFDFANRFRSGEMPVAIVDYTMCNTLEIFAPEIKGMWDIAKVPGTLKEDGSVNRKVAGSGVAAMILNDTKQPEESWEFLKWWTSADIQEKYGQGIENKLGASSRYPTANKDALVKLPWSLTSYKKLTEQMEQLEGMPEVPGGYFTNRHFENAFRKVVYDSENARKTLLEYTRVINEEIIDKRREFGLLEAK